MDSSSSSSILKAHAMLEAQLAHNPQLLAAAKAQMEEQIAASPESFLRNMDNSPKGKIEQCRRNHHHQNHYEIITNALDEAVKQIIMLATMNNDRTTFPAVDLAAGSAYHTSQYALRYRQPFYPASLTWYPTDTSDAIRTVTRPCLQYIMSAECDWVGCRVELRGLKRQDYNGKGGIVLRKDTKMAGRYAVQLDDKAKAISFKAENLVKKDNSNNQEERLLSSSLSNDDTTEQSIYNGLLERTCTLNVLERDTWSELLQQKVKGQCAVVTCTNLLTEIGHRNPFVWQVIMEIASKLLFPGGLLLHGDADGWDGQFGNVTVMEEYAQSVGLALYTKVQLDAWVLMLWKKL